MNSKKKQTVAVAMATALGASAMMSPVAVHALEEDPATAITQESNQQDSTQEVISQNDTPVSEQGLPAYEQPQELNTDSLSSGKPIIQSRANVAFTDYDEARQAIETALADYPVSNATTEQEILDFLRKEFVATGKLKNIYVVVLSKNDADTDSTGTIEIRVAPSPVVSGTQFPNSSQFLTFLIIPRLPKTGEVAIDKANFPDDVFRQYVSDNFDTVKDGVLSLDEISKITGIFVNGETDIKSLKGIEYFTALQALYCNSTGITDLDVSNNTNLLYLYCHNTGISSLDVSNNTFLEDLRCFDTGITTLDVTNNPHLSKLFCYETKITTLNVSNNTLLTQLYCYSTGITSLDISHNNALTLLSCSYTPLAWLNLGTKDFSGAFYKTDSNINIHVTDGSFNIADMFEGIDPKKIDVKSVTGAIYNEETGIISGYALGEPLTYTYDCGTVQGTRQTLKVTLNLHKSDRTIQITGNLDMTYTGKPIVNPSVNSTGSKGAVTFTYEKKNGSAWEVLSDMPTDAGRYRIQAHLSGDDFNNEAVSEKKEFTITQATNSWKNELTIADWTYGRQSNTPTATAQFGNPMFTYSDSKTGTFTSDVPVNAGTWYVKALVAGTDNYTGLESIHAFTISPKDIKDGNITVSDINNDNDVKKLIVKDNDKELVKGTDYDVETKKDGNKKTVTIAFKGNYAGTIEKAYTVETSQPEKPEQKPQQGNPQEKPKDTGSVKTGDSTQTGLLATLSMLSAGCIAFLAGKKRKKNIKEDESTPL